MGTMRRVFPEKEWSRMAPADLAFDETRLKELGCWLQENAGDKDFRVLVVRHGYLAAEWEKGLSTTHRRALASATKSVYSSILGIAIAEAKISSADARVIDYYPELMDVPEGKGPKAGRYAFPKDRDVTFRQLISNTSGYMKPGEQPGTVFHYQTFGMNIITHALGTIYGVYDTEDPGERPGFGELIDRYVRGPIGGSWEYEYMNFDHAPGALVEIFGNYCQMLINARDMARLGWLWLNYGRWKEEQLIPEDWMREASRVAPMIVQNCPKERQAWSYGYGFWTNEYGLLWPNLPRDSFAAIGAGRQLIWICPEQDLVVVQGPGSYDEHHDETCMRVLETVYEAALL